MEKQYKIIIVLLVAVVVLLGRLSYQIQCLDMPSNFWIERSLEDVNSNLKTIKSELSVISITRATR
jgi:hypothetical protein